jgi:hypothetical protein
MLDKSTVRLLEVLFEHLAISSAQGREYMEHYLEGVLHREGNLQDLNHADSPGFKDGMQGKLSTLVHHLEDIEDTEAPIEIN